MEDIRYLWLRNGVIAKLFKKHHYDHTLIEQVSLYHLTAETTRCNSDLGEQFGPGITVLSKLWSRGGMWLATSSVYVNELIVLSKNYTAQDYPYEPAYRRVCTVEWRYSGNHEIKFMGHSQAQLRHKSPDSADANLREHWFAGMHSEETTARYAKVFMALPAMAGEIYKIINNKCDTK